MGSACCVAARDRIIPNRTGRETLNRNVRCSPSWSFCRDNRRRVAGEIYEPSYQVSNGTSRNVSMEIKGTLGSDRSNLSDQGSLHEIEAYGTPASQKSPVREEMGENMTTHPSDISRASNYSVDVKNLAESPNIIDSSTPKLSFCIPSSFSSPITDTSSSHAHLLPPNSTPSQRACHSPGQQLLRQVSDSRILGLKSPNNYSMSEARSSFVLSSCSNGLTARSHGGSSDGWSVCTFSEVVASSQRERWSFDSEHLSSSYGKTNGCSSRFSCSPSIEMRTCGACSKLLAERSAWSTNEISVVSVLVCGHVYHAECLETMTLEADRYDPACPICMVGEKQVSKMCKKALKAEAELKAKHLKLFKNRIIDSSVDDCCDDIEHVENNKREGKDTKLEPSSSRRSSLAKPFLKRHFSIGSKWGRSLSENDSARKKGFWIKYRKD
ncbi:protein TIC 20-I [Hibiscus syriacus]|uniref:Protein TIC 20-I n=1 Tax=Hibiscus syriacus TaxID=106335 RepID=A0A6A3BJD6_HIBSY|nr:uncharacterized protein LOC120216682 [Hibiscus syriacus]XP_039069967.1 uncharacterized protein LOC120216682 [Hibiscus syriacus]KAE8715538.1 protein TIC 20-I [Hibiscus syriacus]